MAKKISHYYVDNKKFYQAIVDHKHKSQAAVLIGKQVPRLSDYIGECIWKIANHLSYKPEFINYSFREEMVDDGIENCLMYFNDFDPDNYQNPFAYFTQITYFAFVRRISKEEKLRYTTYKFFHDTIITGGGSEFLIDADDKHLLPNQVYNNISEFMEKFEKKEKEKKLKRKEAKSLQFSHEEDNVKGKLQRPVSGADCH